MIHNRSTRVLTTLGVTLSLAITAIVGPAFVAAAPAPLTIGFGSTFSSTATTGADPTMVRPGSYVAFEVWARNDGPSTISKLFLTGLTPGEFQSVSVSNTGTDGGCDEGPEGVSELQCSWLGVTPGAKIQVTLVVQTVTNASSMPIDFEWSTTGFVDNIKGKNKSHGDAFKQMDSVALNGDLTRFNGTYLISQTDVGTSEDLSRRNPQFTRANANANLVGKGVTVAEEDPTAADNEACQNAAGAACFGQASVLHIAKGEPVPGGFSVTIGLNLNDAGVDFIHFFDTGGFEPITETCNSTTAPTNIPCKLVSTSGGNTFATLWLGINGRLRSF